MQTVTLELQDESAEKVNNLSKIEKEELAMQLENWLNKNNTKSNTALKAFYKLQDHIASLNLSDVEKEEWIKDSMA